MKWRTKWIMAIIVTGTVLGIAELEKNEIIQRPVTQYISSGKDYIVIKKWIASLINNSSNEQITVSSDGYEESPFATYKSIQPYRKGVIVSYAQPMPIEAQGDGLVLFTGFTRDTGKTVTVLYDDGDEVTYGFVGTFSKLPYSVVKKGDTIALMDEEEIFLMVKQEGVVMDASLLPTYLSKDVRLDEVQ